MIVKNDYNECLTNLACSIRRYFGLSYSQRTLDYVDKLLDERQPKNVVLLLFDGMGSRILNKVLSSDDFFIKNMHKEIFSVFPATTTAATTSIRTGLNPVSHGWLGWDTYIEPIDKTISLFLNCEKGHNDECFEFLSVKDKLVTKTIVDEINEMGIFRACELFPFGDGKYKDLDDMLSIIKKECSENGRKYIYAYDVEPDRLLHALGVGHDLVKEAIKIRNDKVEQLCLELDDTILFVVSDHGHINVDNIFLSDYPEILDMLERVPSLETRTVSFKVKDCFCKQFEKKFNENFGQYFNLYRSDEVVDSCLFGYGDENPLFKAALGNYLAIAFSNKALIGFENEALCSQHAGYTDDEIYVPLIIVDSVNVLEKI